MKYRGLPWRRILISGCTAASLGAFLTVGAQSVTAAPQNLAGAAPGYTLRKVDNLDGYGMSPQGYAYGSNLKTAVAEAVSPTGTVTTLTTPSGDQSFADAGRGDHYAGLNMTTATAVRWTVSAGSVSSQNLASLGNGAPTTEGVDAAGAVVGQSDGLPVIWKAGSTAVTRLPLATGYASGEATSISADGAVIGGDVISPTNTFRAATWLRTSGGDYAIHLLSGTENAVEAVNNAGIEVGGAIVNTGQATEWLPESGGTFKTVDLGGPAGFGCIATSIDNASTPAIIGDCSSGTIYAWVHSGDQTLTDLQPVIAKVDPGVTNTRAMGTDNAGQFLIEAQGSAFADYVLTPTS